MKPAHIDSSLVTAIARHYITAPTSTTTPSVQTSPRASHRLSVHHQLLSARSACCCQHSSNQTTTQVTVM